MIVFNFYYFLIAFSLFFLYFIIITIFGYIISIFIDKNVLKQKISLTSILKSFAIGLSLHLSYSIIIIFLGIFNFFTTYLPFMIFDAIFLIYMYKKNDVIRKKIKNIKKIEVLNYLKQNKDYFLILGIVFIMQYLLQFSVVNSSLGYPMEDPYTWFKYIWFVHENGYLKNTYHLIYPSGYILTCATIISITNDFYVIYYFIKYIPLFLMSINVIVIFLISKKIFKKKSNVFFTLVIFLSFNYLIYRYNMAVPSNLATTLIFLFLLFLNESIVSKIKFNDDQLKIFTKKKLKDKNSCFKGLIFAGIYLSHPLNFFYFIICYVSFEFFILILNANIKQKFSKENLFFISKFFITIFSILVYILLFSLPQIIGSVIYARSIDSLFSEYVKNLQEWNLINNFEICKKPILLFLEDLIEFLKEIGNWLILDSIYDPIYEFFKENIFESSFLEIFEIYFKFTLGLGILVIFFGIFLKFGKIFNSTKKQNYIINFFRFTFVFTLLFITIVYLIEIIEISIFQDFVEFFSTFKKRLLEIFSGFWAIIFVLSINYIYKCIKKSYFKIKKTNMRPNKRLVRLYKISQLIVIILLGGFLYVSNFNRVYTGKAHLDERVDAVLFIGDYFNENPLEEKTVILLDETEDSKPYELLEFNNLEKDSFKFSEDTQYSEFKDYFDDNDCEYALVRKKVPNKFMEEFKEDFDEIYENKKFIFAKIK